jgi:tetratricopeptide (TPR) repeat protein/tRNA A-37 threonylcarbamoyl transferase component Bud32
MDAQRWAAIESLYRQALAKDPGERVSFLAGICPEDAVLRRQVESLLAYADGTLESPLARLEITSLSDAEGVTAPQSDEVPRPADRALPATIGRYRILGVLGEGGMGLVYEAEQAQPRRKVALKVIKPGFASHQQLRRFEYESQVLGRLQHSGIAQIYEAGIADSGFGPQPYFAMELIHGESMLQYADRRQLTTGQRLHLMAKVCEAAHHAHQRGVIHRDLKPSNILVDENGQPKILDFGVACATDGDAQAMRQTDLGQLVGTLAYMSPEQVQADPLEIDTRSDVYSLGVIFYELLAGCPPYKVSRQLHEATRAILEQDGVALGKIRRAYRGDIETIVAKALEKDKTRRYAVAADLAEDIQRCLNDEPILARRASATYHLGKFARRHKTLVAGVAAVFIVLAAGMIASVWEASRALRAEQIALQERDRATAAQQLATEQRDRALTAERTTTIQRNRAIAAEALALEQRNRAIVERRYADTQAATAKAINDFLQNDLLLQATATEHGYDITTGNRIAKTDPDHNLRAALKVSLGGMIQFVQDPELKVRTVLDRAATRATGKFDNQPLVEASIRQTIGDAYADLGLYAEAQQNLERAFELRKRALGEEHRDTIKTILGLALLFLLREQKADALKDAFLTRDAEVEKLLTRALDLRRHSLGENDPDTLTSMNNLALLWLRQRKFQQAQGLFSKALSIEERTLSEENPITLMTMNDLATTYVDQVGLRGVQRDCVPSVSTMANSYAVPTEHEKAERLLTRVMELRKRVLGEEHPDTKNTMHELAELYSSERKYAQAEELFISRLEVQRRTAGETSHFTLGSMEDLADFYYWHCKSEQAEPIYLKMLELQRQTFGHEFPPTIRRLADMYYEKRRYAEAEPLYIKALDGYERAGSNEGVDTLLATRHLGRIYMGQHKYDDAAPLLIHALEIQRRLFGKEDSDTEAELGLVYFREQKYEQAEPLFSKVIEVRRRILGENHLQTLNTMTNLAAVYLFESNYERSEALARETLKGFEKSAMPDSWMRFNCGSILGASLAAQQRYREAEPVLTSAYQEMQQREASIPDVDRFIVTRAGRWVVQLYKDWGRPEKAAEWQESLTSP